MASSLASRSFTLATLAPRACATKTSLHSISRLAAPIQTFHSCSSTDLSSLRRSTLQGFAPSRTLRGADVSGIRAMATKVEKSDQEWRAVLSPEQFRVLRQKGTEYPSSSPLDKTYDDGVYECAGCGTPLYKSTTKFKSGCGWPAFYEGLPGAISRHADPDGRRIEITCTACGGHLGHVFKGEGFPTPTDERHCVNGISLKFTPAE
eukprot:TRINITY_DN10763_c0_g1_i1.p1 TRINITY_DN10763_c0_g1~~TRINITY_DN10763_c0_g1_i1.p1  ORF type:complete len:227 (+),score=10.51 TRINITY_DN10763_c0_g1_i1:64-681(+)